MFPTKPGPLLRFFLFESMLDVNGYWNHLVDICDDGGLSYYCKKMCFRILLPNAIVDDDAVMYTNGKIEFKVE